MNERKKAHQTQGALRLLEALGGVDEDLLARSGAPDTTGLNHTARKVTHMSDYKKRHRPAFIFGRTVAACLVFVIVGVLSWSGLQLILVPKGTSGSGADSGGSNQSSHYDAVTGDAAPRDGQGMDGEGGLNGNMDWNESAPRPLEDLQQELQEEQTTGSAYPGGAAEENGGSDSGSEREEESRSQTEEDMEKSSESSTDKLENQLLSRKLTEEEARGMDLVGAYIPSDIPDGYVFESARADEQGSVTVTWFRGMDSMMVTVSPVIPETFETVDVSRPEVYDQRLYEIPYGESVPAEYIETFQDPLFAYDDLSLEIVSSRMTSAEDAGDTDAPRGIFSVLYPDDGVLLHFNGRGTAEEIWNMLQSSSFSRMR